MKIELRSVGLPTGGSAPAATAEVSTETDQRAVELDLPEGATVEDLLSRAGEMGVPVEQVEQILLDGSSVDRSTPLRDGAAVTLIGQVHGV